LTSRQPSQLALIEALAAQKVDFLLIGGHAVGAHGFDRATKDVDIVPATDAENLERLLKALLELEAQMEPIDIPEHGEALSVEWLAQGGNFIFETRLGRLDVLQFVADMTYRELAANAVWADLGDGLRVQVCAYEDLVRMKEAAGRDQDLVDLQRLREAREES
jgi:hypothetical protein